MLNKIFDQTLRQYGITGKELSLHTGISQNHISEFRRGKGDVSTAILWRLIVGAEEIAPGSKQYFSELIMGKSRPVGQELEFLIDVADISELEAAMLQIVRRMFPNGDKNHKEDELGRLKSSVPW